jgi:hypothetical protein
MSSKNNIAIPIFNFDQVWKRVKQETDINTQTELAKAVGVKQASVSGRKANNVWPEEWAVRIALKYSLLTEWLLTGNGPKRLEETQRKAKYEFQILNDLENWLNELVIGEPYRKEWFRGAIEDSFPMFREWKKRREKEESASDIDPQSNVA